jgi:transposase-like protein
MSGQKRRSFDDAFKAKVCLEAIRGEKTIEELAGEHQIHPNQIRTWKREFEAGAAKVFSAEKDASRELRYLQEEKSQLEQLIGKQTIELNWLKKTAERLNLL